MVEPILYLEIDTVGLAILLIIYYFGSLDTSKLAVQRVFNSMLLTTAIILCSDGASWLLEGVQGSAALVALYLTQTLFFAMTVCICGQYLLYLRLSSKKNPNGKLRTWPYFLPTAAFAVLLLLNVWTGWIFSYDAAHVYHRGPLYLLHPALVVGHFAYAVSMVRRHSRHKNKARRRDDRRSLLFALPPFLSIFVQVFVYGISLIPISIALSLLITFVQRQNARVTVDHLTGLSNYRAFERFMDKKLQNPPIKHLLFLMILDADSFKKINDTYGHAVGNEALIKIASALKLTCPRSDFIARQGGDEFAICGCRETEAEIRQLRRAIDARLAKENSRSDTPYRLSLSIGYTVFDAERHTSADAFLHAADRHMYQIKQQRQHSTAHQKS